MREHLQFAVLAIPLNRAQARHFLHMQQPQPRGVPLTIVGQRPSPEVITTWAQKLEANPTLAQFLTLDNPHNHLKSIASDRLVPVEFLQDPDYMIRALGGWSPIFFAVGALPPDWQQDPVLQHAERLLDYGRSINSFGADVDLVAMRLEEEIGVDERGLCAAAVALHKQRQQIMEHAAITARMGYCETLYSEIASGDRFADRVAEPIPKDLLLDDLLAQLVQIELVRREAIANQNTAAAAKIAAWQEAFASQKNLAFILKGEYIVGRHRGSMVLILPELGVVVKQPAPEPFHEIQLEARTVNGRPENWPVLTHDGSLVTSRGRVCQVVEENLLPALLEVFQHQTRFSTLMGLIIEPFVPGPTVQEIALADPQRLTPDLYDIFILHQQVCEQLGIENGDWHAANFIERAEDGEIVHIDWGAARLLRPDERTPGGQLARLNQVQNIAFSFHNEALAQRVRQLHQTLLNKPQRLSAIGQRAQALIDSANIKL